MPAQTHDQAVAHKQSVAAAVPATPKIWRHVIEPDPTSAVNFLNLPPVQVAGEAFASNRANGQVDLYYFL